jgi:hypothetical protein
MRVYDPDAFPSALAGREGVFIDDLQGLSLEFPMHGRSKWFRSQQRIPSVLQEIAPQTISISPKPSLGLRLI